MFKLVKFQKSKTKGKKYDAIIEDTTNKKRMRVPFGAIGYEQYRDDTGLKLYTRYDHLDKERKKNYLKRHQSTRFKKWSPSWFSAVYLWDA
jgi:hypothetical protein